MHYLLIVVVAVASATSALGFSVSTARGTRASTLISSAQVDELDLSDPDLGPIGLRTSSSTWSGVLSELPGSKSSENPVLATRELTRTITASSVMALDMSTFDKTAARTPMAFADRNQPRTRTVLFAAKKGNSTMRNTHLMVLKPRSWIRKATVGVSAIFLVVKCLATSLTTIA
eukprot:CAMPEP_0197446410 /NCGR_PEP_ID=MMETSP1175-20131217/11358_1 /TAXON_ID=1003142 /ORGANISM="Triceratium dubium, Strain CCMP147" /LENGTH=173 /DNA_ID=CAMNT_0042977519 /DNA_START=213 /DNA_END=734 /DNA_ORIENTATION=+